MWIKGFVLCRVALEIANVFGKRVLSCVMVQASKYIANDTPATLLASIRKYSRPLLPDFHDDIDMPVSAVKTEGSQNP